MLQNKLIGNKITEARKKINISQAQLADQLFISPQAVGKWERGESMPDILMFTRLAEIFGVDLNYFLEGIKPMMADTIPNEVSEKQPAQLASEKKNKLNWDMSRGNWTDADFSGLKNLHEKFSSSNMKNCKFIGSEMTGLILKNNNIDNCDFSGANISNSHIQYSNLTSNQFKNCLFKEAEFSGSYIAGCDFSEADFAGVKLKSGAFVKNIITKVVWSSTSFIDTAIADIVFEGKLEDCYFDNCAFSKVTFQTSMLTNTFFKCKTLKGLKFIDCQADRMTYEFLKNGKADMSGITLLTT